ncbi:MAG TPA: hypothetical protein VMX97_16240 [Hyphomicrobiaceae bacterium]|nr:hypothetical protein [Hyphomicrobiaceae bacterium]
MVHTSSVSGTGSASQYGRHDPDWHDRDWDEPAKVERDWKKIVLVAGLGGLSWVATYVGMLELIQSNMGELSLLHKVVIGFSVAMLMIMIIWLLDQLFAPLPLTTRLAYIFGYLFLTLISVGFGFGFYWKVLESRSEASRSAESAVAQVQSALFGASSRLDQLQTTLEQLTRISSEKAINERERGASCPNSRPGDGPRRKLRDDDAARFSFASEFVKGRGTKVKSAMSTLDVELKKITSADKSIVDPKTGTRNKFLQSLTRRLELTATGFNAFRTDPQLRQIRSELAERSTKTTFPTGRGNNTFSCPDPQLQSALRGVVRAIDQLPELGKPEIATVEGAQAVVEAFRRLTTTLFGVLSFKLPPSADELRALQQRAVQSVENAAARQQEISNLQGGLSKRDYIPLGIAMFVDLCLLLVSIGRPMNRLHNLVPKMKEAERGPVYQILSRFGDIHRDPEVREKFEVFRHVVFDFNGDYYVAVPLDAPRNRNPEEAEKLLQEAHLLGNLFASFEKERIFSRVYTPLLTRKTIKRKLQQQGSKFSGSEAFRIYRFKDGAWSDIILGAVMGAAKRANYVRRNLAEARGPSLGLPSHAGPNHAGLDQAGISPTPAAAPAAAGEFRIPAGAVRSTNTPHTPAWALPNPHPEVSYEAMAAQSEAAAAHIPDADTRAKFGPYAHSIRSETPADDGSEANGRDGARAYPRPSSGRWPYRKQPAPPAEADVDVRDAAANNNTSPDRALEDGTDNVIPMPSSLRPAGTPPLDGAVTTPQLAYGLDGSAHAVKLSPLAGIEEDDATPIAQAVRFEASASGNAAALINVRITERTADFSVPVTDAELPQRLLARFGTQAPSVGLLSDRPAASGPLITEAELPLLLSEAGSDDFVPTMPLTEAEMPPAEPDHILAGELTGHLAPITETDELFDATDAPPHDAPDSDDEDDPMLRVAHRFAARTHTPG